MNRISAWLLGGAMALPILAAGFVADSASGAGGTSDVSCETILGSVGLLVDWTHSKPTNKSLRSTNGKCGATWSGSRYESCAALPEDVTEDSFCRHQYNRSGGSTNVTITLTTQMEKSGTANRLQEADDSWWWTPSIQIHDVEPIITLWTDDLEESMMEGWDTITDAYDHVAAHGTGGSASPAPGATLAADYAADTGGATSGSFAGSSGTIAQQSKWKFITVDYHVLSSANRSSDNVRVNGTWRVALRSTMDTSVP
ncbi:MAG: hypothetical protein ACT4PV_12510 [Planctomycetaceae bacterium]